MKFLTQATDPPVWEARLEALTGRLAFDIGANGGNVTRAFAAHFEKVVSIEPCAESFAQLEATAAENVTPIQMAVSAKTGTVTLQESALSIASGQLTSPGPTLDWGDVIGYREVPATTVDDLAYLYGWPDVVKIDTEGHEAEVLRGAPETLARRETAWYLEIHSKDLGVECASILIDAGYVLQLVRHPFYHRLHNPGLYTGHYYLAAT